jgi:ubiquitin
MAERTGFMEVLEYSNVVFNDSQFEDLVIYTESSEQNILLGTLQSNLSTLALRSNVATFNSRVGILNSNPSVALEINSTDAILIPQGTTAQRPSVPSKGQIRYNTQINTFEGYGAGNAWGSLGGVKDTNQDTYISAESFPTSNDDTLVFYNSNIETMRITSTGRIGISNQSPSEFLELSGGNAKFNSNIFVLQRQAIGTSNPTESLDITGNLKVSSNIYTLSRLGVGTSNPSTSVEINATDAMLLPKGTTVQRPGAPIQGQIRYNTQINTFEGYGAGNAWGSLGGVKDTNQDTYISAESFPTSNDDTLVFYNSNVETMRITKDGKIGISNQTPSEFLELSGGNAKFNSNIYVLQRQAIGTSNPTESLDLIGNIKASSNIYSLSRLGVGTSNPSTSVEINATDAMLLPKGTTAQRPNTPSQGQIRYNTQINTFEGYGAGNAWGSLGGVKDTNQDTYISAESFPTSNDDTLVFYNSNVETMRITSTGKVGIGTSNPSQMLHVDGKTYLKDELNVNSNIKIAGNILPSSNEIYNLGASNSRFKDLYLSGNTIYLGDSIIQKQEKGIVILDSNNKMGTATVSMLSLSNFGEVALHTSNNNFGIGISNPLYKVHIAGSTYIQDDIYINSNLNINRGLILQGLRIKKNQGGNANLSPISVPGLSNDASGFLQLYTSYSESNIGIKMLTGLSNEYVRLTGDGRFGIRTTNPSEVLHVQGKVFTTNQILGYAGDSSDIPGFSWTNDSNTGMYHPAEDTLALVTNGIERARILSTGNFGIGIANPSTLLQVNGTTTSTLFSGSGSNLTTLNASSLFYGTTSVSVGGTGATTLTTSKVLVGNGTNTILQPTNFHWDNANTRLGIGNSAPGYPLEVTGAIYASGDIIAMSDMRYKDNIVPIKNALETSLKLNGYKYTRKDYDQLKDDKNKTYIGLLAQETQYILPEIVTYDKENDKFGLNYGSLTALILEAIKDMRNEYITKIEQLEKKIQDISGKM